MKHQFCLVNGGVFILEQQIYFNRLVDPIYNRFIRNPVFTEEILKDGLKFHHVKYILPLEPLLQVRRQIPTLIEAVGQLRVLGDWTNLLKIS